MSRTFTTVIIDLPQTGGLTGNPSVLRRVVNFLSTTTYYQELNQILQEDGCDGGYESMIDCLLVELAPQFQEECREFYEEKGKPLANLYPKQKIDAIDDGLVKALKVFVSKQWSTWAEFKRNCPAVVT